MSTMKAFYKVPLAFLTVCLALDISSASYYSIEKVSACTAKIMHGGKTHSMLDLTALDSGDPTKPAFTINGGGYNYLYNPCSGLNLNSPCNTQEAVCQNSGSTYYAAGRLNFTTFEFIKLGEIAMSIVQDPADPTSRRSHFHLLCEKTVTKANITFTGEHPDGNYNFVFHWSEFCNQIPSSIPATLGVGSILLMVFFPAVILYLAIGVVVQKVRGAEGLDLIPNSTLWRDFPHLVKGGFWFILSPCCGGGGGGKGGYDAL